MAASTVNPAARTWRCIACGQVYVDLAANGVRMFHTCPLLEDPATGAETRRPGHRDENILQDRPGGPVRMREPGAGRELLAKADLVTGASAAARAALLARPAIGSSPAPDDPPENRGPYVMPFQGE